MGQRRRLKGKKLLVASFGLGAASTFGCGDSDGTGPPDAVANLVMPPQEAGMDAPADAAADAEMDADAPADAQMDAPVDAPSFDAPVANLVLPPDGSASDDGGGDGS